MTINSETRVAGPFEGNDSTVAFPFAFKVFDSDEVLVVRATDAIETVLTLGADYSVTLNPDQNASPGGIVTLLLGALATGSTLTLTSDLEFLQPLDLTNQGGFYPRVINNAFDRATILLQQLSAIVGRTLKFPLSDGPVGDLPGRAARAGTVLAFDVATGEPIAGPDIGQLGTVAAGIAAIGTVASNIVNVNTVAGNIADVNTLVGNLANVNTVADNIADVNTVADNIADVNTVADNLADVSNFAGVYYGASTSDPATRRDGSPLQAGDLYLNTVTDSLRAYNGTAWRESVTGVVTVQNLSGDGVETEFLLNYAPESEVVTSVFVSGVYQQKNTYELGGVGGDVLIFSEAPPAGTNNIEVVVSSLTPSDDKLRQDLANPTIGDTILAHLPPVTGGVATTVAAKLGKIVTLRDFGVVGDGVANDTAALTLAMAHNGVVLGQGLTVLTDGFTITGAAKLDMQGGTIKVRSAFQRITVNASGVEFRNTVFDADGFNVDVCLFRIPTTYVGWVFDHCTFKNITGIAGSANQYGIYVELDNAIGRVSNCTFQNISNVSNGTPTSAFCGSMLLAATTVGAKDLVIENVTIMNVECSGIAGNINNSDADGIRVFGPQPTAHSNMQMRGITCIDVQKSGIKTSGCRGLVASDIIVYNDRSDIGMIAGLRFQAADYAQISNVTLIGRMNIGVNIRSRNIGIDGINYRPIDTARDTLPGGLIQLQSNDTYPTRNVKVSNVIGQNVSQPFDVDTSGTTINPAFSFIEFHHWDVTAPTTLGAGTTARIQKSSHFILDHVYFWDSAGAFANLIACTDVSNFKAHGCRFDARREVFTWSPGCNGIEFDYCSFFRQDSESTNNFRQLLLRDTSAGALDRVTVRNCTFSVPAYSAVGNQQCILLNATNAVVDGVTIYVRDAGANVSPPSGWVGMQGSGYKISDVKVSSQSALTNGSGGYAVDLSTLATGSVVTDIMNNSGPGVRASAGGNNNLIDSVAGKVTAVANAGTGNTVGSAHVLP